LFKKLFNYDLPSDVVINDTLLLSQVLDYRRFGFAGHSLEAWGEHFDTPKVQHEDWSQYSEDMKHRCLSDVELNVKVYNKVINEFRYLKKKDGKIATHMRAEQAVSKWQATAELIGWPFDVENGFLLYDKLEIELERLRLQLEPRLGMKAVAVDKCKGEVDVKVPKWTKQGCYNAHTASWFDVDPWSGFEGEERPIVGPFCRVSFESLKLSSPADVKIFLFRHNWEPTEWNTKRGEDGKIKKTSPKITDDSLDLLGGDGALYREFTSAESRFGILKTWLENLDWDGNLHGNSMIVGTPSMRLRHNVIVNIPSGDSLWGKEMRELFICPEGWKVIGCDSSGNQARGLAHYLNDDEFTDVILNKDIHIYNAKKLIEVLDKMKVEHEFTPETLRPKAKRILYAFLFGASGKKLWGYLFGVQDVKKGNILKKGFTEAVPGFKNLLDKLSNIYGKTSQTGYGYIPSLSGNRIYVDSFHKLLVYLLQAAEKITCAAALMLTMERLEEKKIPYVPLIMMHDEIQFRTPEKYAEEAAKIGKQAFVDGPKLFDVNIMDGDSKIGDNWFQTH
jgi:hypothetical protein